MYNSCHKICIYRIDGRMDGWPGSKMLFPEPKLDIPFPTRLFRRPPDLPGGLVGPTEVHSHIRPPPLARFLRFVEQVPQIRPVPEPVAHRREQTPKIRAAEVGAGAQFGEWIQRSADGVQIDVGGCIDVQPLRQVRVDAEKFGGRGFVAVA